MIYKAQVAVADVDRGYYADHALTLARHPSETEERMMVRLLAFALHADPDLVLYGGSRANQWWRQNAASLERFEHLSVLQCDEEGTRALARLADRNMTLSCTIQEGDVLVSDGRQSATVKVTVLKVV